MRRVAHDFPLPTGQEGTGSVRLGEGRGGVSDQGSFSPCLCGGPVWVLAGVTNSTGRLAGVGVRN